MLKEILSISGKPGLFKLISQGKNMYIVESLVDGKRIPVYAKDKIVSLGDIAIYTTTEEIPLATVFNNIKIKEAGEPKKFHSGIQSTELRTYFEQILPDFDRDKVYPSDIKKIVNWYNLLLNVGISDFEQTVEQEQEEKEEKDVEPKETAQQ